MATNTGNWFQNQKEVSDKIQKLDSSGTFSGSIERAVTTYVADGAIDPTADFVELDASAASTAMTLAAGSDGHEMTVICSDSTNTADIDADFGGATATATLTVGDGLTLISQDDVWYITGNNGAVLS
jgi:hypothetical protein